MSIGTLLALGIMTFLAGYVVGLWVSLTIIERKDKRR